MTAMKKETNKGGRAHENGPSYHRGEATVHFKQRPELIGMSVRTADRSMAATLDDLKDRLHLTRENLPPRFPAGG